MPDRDRKPTPAAKQIDNHLGANTSVRGTIRSDGNLRIDGVCEGRIEAAGNVIIGASARIVADIVARAVQVAGTVQGDVTAQRHVEVLSTGRVRGNVHSASLRVDAGGLLEGQCVAACGDAESLFRTLFGALSSAPEEATAVLGTQPRLALLGEPQPPVRQEATRSAIARATAAIARWRRTNSGSPDEQSDDPDRVP